MSRLLIVASVPAVLTLAFAGSAGSESSVVPGINGRIVIQGTELGASQYAPSHLFVFNPDAYGYFIPLTRGKAFDANPEWSPDGTKIAFLSDRSGNNDIWVMNADGSGLTQLTTDPHIDWDPAWSPAGTE